MVTLNGTLSSFVEFQGGPFAYLLKCLFSGLEASLDE